MFWPLFARSERLERFFHQPAAHVFLLLERDACITDHVNDAVSQDHPVRPHHFSDGESRGNLHGRDPRLLQLGRDRSTAARARPSGRCEDDGIDACAFRLLGHLPPHATRIGKRIG